MQVHGSSRLWRHGHGCGPQTTGEKSRGLAGAGKIRVGKDHLVLPLPGIRANRTARLVFEDRVLPLALRPLPRLVRRQREDRGLGPRGWSIHHHPAVLVARVQQASTRSIRCPPQPAAMGARIPVRAGWNGLGQPDLPAGLVNQYEAKTRTCSGPTEAR